MSGGTPAFPVAGFVVLCCMGNTAANLAPTIDAVKVALKMLETKESYEFPFVESL